MHDVLRVRKLIAKEDEHGGVFEDVCRGVEEPAIRILRQMLHVLCSLCTHAQQRLHHIHKLDELRIRRRTVRITRVGQVARVVNTIPECYLVLPTEAATEALRIDL